MRKIIPILLIVLFFFGIGINTISIVEAKAPLRAAFKPAATGAKVSIASRSYKTAYTNQIGAGSLARSTSSVSSTYKAGAGAGSLARATPTAGVGQGSMAGTWVAPKAAFRDAAKPLNPSQIANVQKFQNKMKANKNITYQKLPNNGVAVQSYAPANNTGYGKLYEKQIGSSGKTINFSKTTYDATKPNIKILKVDQNWKK